MDAIAEASPTVGSVLAFFDTQKFHDFAIEADDIEADGRPHFSRRKEAAELPRVTVIAGTETQIYRHRYRLDRGAATPFVFIDQRKAGALVRPVRHDANWLKERTRH